MEKQEQKFGAIDLTELAIGVLILGLTVSVGAIILDNMATSQITNAPTYQIYNESVASVTNAGEVLSTAWVKSVDTVYNATNSLVVTTGNYSYTIDSTTGYATIKSITSGLYNNTNWNVTYTVYNTSDPRYDLPFNASTGIAEYGNWFKILVIVGIAAVILSLIFMAFGKADGQSESAGIGY